MLFKLAFIVLSLILSFAAFVVGKRYIRPKIGVLVAVGVLGLAAVLSTMGIKRELETIHPNLYLVAQMCTRSIWLGALYGGMASYRRENAEYLQSQPTTETSLLLTRANLGTRVSHHSTPSLAIKREALENARELQRASDVVR